MATENLRLAISFSFILGRLQQIPTIKDAPEETAIYFCSSKKHWHIKTGIIESILLF